MADRRFFVMLILNHMTIIIQDFKRELSVWQQQLEVEANHYIVPKTLGIPVTVFFFHYKDGVS